MPASGVREGTCFPADVPSTTTPAPTIGAVTSTRPPKVVEQVPKTMDLTDIFAGRKFVTISSAQYKCCCKRVDEVALASGLQHSRVACELKVTTRGCGTFGPGVHSWNN